jgi:peptide chain release factor 1
MVTITLDKSIPGFHNEAGGHRIQRVPPNEKRGRVHTSTVTCAVLDQVRATTAFDDRAEKDFSYRWFSGTGKGGQHRNKHQNCLELTHIPTGLSQIANGRSREANEREAMAKMICSLDCASKGQNSEKMNESRAGQIGSGMRGDKRRTYRFQDDSITDHVTGKTVSCKRFMRGDIERLW